MMRRMIKLRITQHEKQVSLFMYVYIHCNYKDTVYIYINFVSPHVARKINNLGAFTTLCGSRNSNQSF